MDWLTTGMPRMIDVTMWQTCNKSSNSQVQVQVQVHCPQVHVQVQAQYVKPYMQAFL